MSIDDEVRTEEEKRTDFSSTPIVHAVNTKRKP